MRKRRGARKIAGMRLVLDLDRGSPIAGVVRADGAGERPFHGWLDLLGALEEAVGHVNAEEDRDDPQHPVGGCAPHRR